MLRNLNNIEEPYRSRIEEMIALFQDDLEILSHKMQDVWLMIVYGNMIIEEGYIPRLFATIATADGQRVMLIQLDWPVRFPIATCYIVVNTLHEHGDIIEISLGQRIASHATPPSTSYPYPFSRS